MTTSNGVRLYYIIVGDKPDTLIMINGGPGLAHQELQGTRFLSKYAKLVYFDQRGTGKSSKTKPEEYTIENNVLDIEALRDGLGLSVVSLFGFSWGAALALEYAVKYPSNVKRLILVSSFTSTEDINLAFQSIKFRAPKKTQEILERYEQNGLYENGRYPDEYLHALQEAYETCTTTVTVPNTLIKVFANLNWDVYRTIWGEKSEFLVTGTMKNYDVRRRLREIIIPTLIIIGDSDMVPIDLARRDAQSFQNSRLVVLEDAKHFSFLDQPKKFEKAVADFLKEST